VRRVLASLAVLLAVAACGRSSVSTSSANGGLAPSEVAGLTEALNADINAVRHIESLADYGMPARNLEDGVAMATDVVIGHVQMLAFEGSGRVVTFEVERSFKKQTAYTIELSLGGGLVPGQSGSVELVDDDAQPQFAVGARLALFIQRIDGARFAVLPFVGAYDLSDGTVGVRTSSPEFHRLSGLHEQQFVELSTTALR